jgi:hypothetical protein
MLATISGVTNSEFIGGCPTKPESIVIDKETVKVFA